jgi:hypothetical protein
MTRARSRADLVSASPITDLAFLDLDLLHDIDSDLGIPFVIGILDCKPHEALEHAVRALEKHPWLSHIILSSELAAPDSQAWLARLLERKAAGPERRFLGPSGIGRVALLANASRRHQRFDRIGEFFTKHGMNERANVLISEVAEELVMNALYDAPTEAGYFSSPRRRDEDVELPPQLACQISYGIDAGSVFIRVSDPFGALTRSRIVEVLARCNNRSVALDESRGGAGLGLWRIFSIASTIMISVVPGLLTEILVGIKTRNGRLLTKQLEGLHLFFDEEVGVAQPATHDRGLGLMDQSVTLVFA